MGDPVLAVRGLGKVFGDHVAVKDVSFDLAERGAIGIVGESGSGKTTVARMIVGLESSTAGEIFCCGRDRSRAGRGTRVRRVRAQEVQIVFQDPYTSLDPRRTIGETLSEAVTLHHDGVTGIANRVGTLAEMVALDQGLLTSLPARLSGGQRQRVAIARALAARPRVLILDEAVAALDVSIQAQILNLLADIRQTTDVSYVFITHDLAVVRQVTDSVLVMRQGRVVERGATDDVLSAPQHAYTRELLASVPRPGWRPSRRTPADRSSVQERDS